MGTKEFRDPLYQFIHVTPHESELINSEPFQRLRYIHQLGLTYLVYPGAEHKRFEHSLGTMEIASKVFDILSYKNKDIFLEGIKTNNEQNERLPPLFKNDKELKRYRQILRFACLLHDIGHYPFSHGSEDVWSKNHEEISRDIILSEPIKSIIEKDNHMNIEAEEVSFVATKEPTIGDAKLQVLVELLQGDLGTDRIDYLIRDSLHSGVLYGMFDYHRLIDTFTIYLDEEHNPRLGLESGGVYSAEGLILARYFMFLQVYYHKTRNIYDYHLKNYLKVFVKDSGIDYTKLNEFLKLEDFTLLSHMKNDARLNKTSKRKIFADIILNRKHHHCVDQVDGNLFSTEINPEEVYNEIKDKITKKYPDEVTAEDIVFDNSKKKTNKFEEVEFHVYDKDFAKKNPIKNCSQLIKKLKSIDLFRVYVKWDRDDIRLDLKKIIQTIKESYEINDGGKEIELY